MKKAILATAACVLAVAATAQVKPGIEVLRDNGFRELQGKRVGLITNPSGVDNSLRSTIDILAAAPGVQLTALYAPERRPRGQHRGSCNRSARVLHLRRHPQAHP